MRVLCFFLRGLRWSQSPRLSQSPFQPPADGGQGACEACTGGELGEMQPSKRKETPAGRRKSMFTYIVYKSL